MSFGNATHPTLYIWAKLITSNSRIYNNLGRLYVKHSTSTSKPKEPFTNVSNQILGTLTFHQQPVTTGHINPANYQLSKTNTLKMDAQGL